MYTVDNLSTKLIAATPGEQKNPQNKTIYVMHLHKPSHGSWLNRSVGKLLFRATVSGTSCNVILMTSVSFNPNSLTGSPTYMDLQLKHISASNILPFLKKMLHSARLLSQNHVTESCQLIRKMKTYHFLFFCCQCTQIHRMRISSLSPALQPINGAVGFWTDPFLRQYSHLVI